MEAQASGSRVRSPEASASLDAARLERACRGLAAADSNELAVFDLGRVDYDRASELQEALRDRRLGGAVPDLLLLLEHWPVYTLGRGAAAQHVGRAGLGATPLRRVSRGGQVTFHGPGQLVGYPIVDLRRRGADVRAYVRRLERVLIRAVGRASVAGDRIDGLPGVWVDGRKLASIGIGIRRWVTTHGFALNVTTDLSYFDRIVPCGIAGVRMTSLEMEAGRQVDARRLRADVAELIAEELGYSRSRWGSLNAD